MKAILVIADGLGGRPSDGPNGSCLQAAATPTLDALASRGALGLLDPIGPGIRPGSDTAHLSILGYNPSSVYTGRGAFECLGIGMDVACGDVCFRANFATVEPWDDALPVVTDRRAGRIETGQAELAAALHAVALKAAPDVRFEFAPSTEHRGALILRGPGLSRHVSENDPHVEASADDTEENREAARLQRSRPLHDDEAARRTATIVNEIARRSYEAWREHPVNLDREAHGKHPANVLLLRGASELPKLEPIGETYGVRGAVIAGGALYRGVALAAGMTSLSCPGATGGLDTDLTAKATAAIDALEDHGLIFVHIKGTDNAGHDGDGEAKRRFIERIDAEFFARLIARIDLEEVHLAFTGDHTTPIRFGDHAPDPVPVMFVGPNVMPDGCTRFDERAAGAGGLGRFSGQVLPMLLGYCDRSPKFGS